MIFRVFLYSAILLIIMQISVFGVYKVPSAYLAPSVKRNDIIVINNLAFGLHLPFMKGSIIEWGLPKRNDMIVIKTKNNKKLLKRVLGLPGDVLLVDGHRFIVPKDSVFVGIDLENLTLGNGSFGLIFKTRILGKLVFIC